MTEAIHDHSLQRKSDIKSNDAKVFQAPRYSFKHKYTPDTPANRVSSQYYALEHNVESETRITNANNSQGLLNTVRSPRTSQSLLMPLPSSTYLAFLAFLDATSLLRLPQRFWPSLTSSAFLACLACLEFPSSPSFARSRPPYKHSISQQSWTAYVHTEYRKEVDHREDELRKPRWLTPKKEPTSSSSLSGEYQSLSYQPTTQTYGTHTQSSKQTATRTS